MPFERGPPARRGAGLAAHACSLRSRSGVVHSGPRARLRTKALGGLGAPPLAASPLGDPRRSPGGDPRGTLFSGAGSSSVARRLRQHRFARSRSRPRNFRGSQLRRARFFGGTHRHPHGLAELGQGGNGSAPDLGTRMEPGTEAMGVTNRPPRRRPILDATQTTVPNTWRWQVCWAIRPHHDQPSLSRQRGPDAHTCHRPPVTRPLDHSRQPRRGNRAKATAETTATTVTVPTAQTRPAEVGGVFRPKGRPHRDKLTLVDNVGRPAGESGTHRPAVKGANLAGAATGVQ